MKRRRSLVITPLALLLVIGALMGFLMHVVHQKQLDDALIAAIKSEDTGKVLAALKVGADPNTHYDNDDNKDPSLSLGERLQQLLDRLQNPGSKAVYEETALTLLLSSPHKDNPSLITALLNAGADPNLPSRGGGSTPLSCAVTRAFPESYRILLAHGANIRWKSPDGFTILHAAAGWGNPERVRSLLHAGLDIEVKDNMGETPLVYACEYNELDTVETLIAHGANVNVRCGKKGFTPLDSVNSKNIAGRLRQAGAKTGKELGAELATRSTKSK